MNFHSNLILVVVVFLVAATLIICEPTKPPINSVITENCEINYDQPPPPVIAETPAVIKKNVETDILFNFNRYKLTPEGKEVLNKIIPEIAPNTLVTVIGHSDRIGKSSYNQRLSKKRASEVVKYLKTKIKNDIQYTGVGSAIASGETENCHKHDRKCFQPDRRIEIQFTTK